MLPFTIRVARESDDQMLAYLASMAVEPAVHRPALIGEADGMPVAAISLADGRLVADPYHRAPGLEHHLRLARSGWPARGTRDAMRRHVRAVLPFLV
ncbi:MAG TPA: hypothetical protein VFZ00_08030 [Solirubrobacter sp.]|jgi:hypothetical protein|nr:hypothetical protein [Solirubrobacter sp.]